MEGNWKRGHWGAKVGPLSANADLGCSQMVPPLTPSPVPWSLSWRDDGDLAPQDHFDLLQSLLLSETPEVQPSLVVALERLSIAEISTISTGGVTELCA